MLRFHEVAIFRDGQQGLMSRCRLDPVKDDHMPDVDKKLATKGFFAI